MMYKKLILLSMMFLSTNVIAGGFYLSSDDINGQIDEAQVFNSFGCTGKNISPQLSWKNAPADTKSFAITVYDPDAPTGSGWWHWLVFNIPKSVDLLNAGASTTSTNAAGTSTTGNSKAGKAMPAGSIESMTSYGSPGFGGACPPEGDKPHRYIFTVYALNTDEIKQGADARPELIGFFLNSHAIARASIMAYYGR